MYSRANFTVMNFNPKYENLEAVFPIDYSECLLTILEILSSNENIADFPIRKRIFYEGLVGFGEKPEFENVHSLNNPVDRGFLFQITFAWPE